MKSADRVYCDNFGCDESYPKSHPDERHPGFVGGRWLGWFYLDINRPDLTDRELRFCDIRCLTWWLETTKTAGASVRNRHVYDEPTVLDELAVRRTVGR